MLASSGMKCRRRRDQGNRALSIYDVQLFWFTRGPPNVMHEALRGWPLLVLQ
ncbi:hypothetical protein PVAP13_1KG167725 [Panicum virgatum]|uniref:Uncharacterized protein n=1 Tax=Panicum virgatum TaxID=38727 RepID=A0A8T0XLB1_PANVG|nr:hypothetical protein PVAP13_1KG167725 [Panicum virgatum]